jgi:hypothetical protein
LLRNNFQSFSALAVFGWLVKLLEIMAKSKRTRRARNIITDSLQGALVTTGPPLEPVIAVQLSSAFRVGRHTIFTAEFERVIEIIARERVYRAMLAKLGSRLLMAPTVGDVSSD